MKKIIFLLAILISFNSYSQTSGIIDGKFYTASQSYTWWKGGKFSVLNLPNAQPALLSGRSVGSIYYNIADSSAYLWTGNQWLKIASGAGGSSVISFNSRVGVVNPIKADYAQFFLDTTYRRADSVFGKKDGVELFQYALESDSAETYQWSVIDSLSTPPATVFEGDKFLVGTSPTGAFVGHANEIATYDGSVYTFETAASGDLLYNATLAVVDKFNGSVWNRIATPTNVNWWTRFNEFNVVGQFARIGVNTFSSVQANSTSYGFKTFLANPNGNAGTTAIGAFALHHNNALGYNNTAIGDRAMWYTNSGHDNVAVGKNAMSASGNVNYSIALGTNSVGQNNTFVISDFVTKMVLKLDSAVGSPYSIVGVDALGNWRRFAPVGGGSSYTFTNGVKEAAGTVTAGGYFETDSISYISNSNKTFRIQSRLAAGTTFMSDWWQNRSIIAGQVIGSNASTYGRVDINSTGINNGVFSSLTPSGYGSTFLNVNAFQAAVYNGTVGRMLKVSPTVIYFMRENGTTPSNEFFADSSKHNVRQVYGDNYRSLFTPFTLVDKGYVDSLAGTISGSTVLNNVGTGYDVAVQGTDNVKRLQAGFGIKIDSATSNVVKISLDTTTQTLTDGATITFDANAGVSAKVTLGGNRTLAFSNFSAGVYLTLVVIQDGTGGRTLTLPTCKVINGGAGAVTLTTAAASEDILTFFKVGTTIYCNYGKNYN
jgi:hypothetical protein